MLNEEGILTYKTLYELAYEFGTEEQIQETDSVLALPQSDSLLFWYTEIPSLTESYSGRQPTATGVQTAMEMAFATS